MPLFILSGIIQLALIVHALKTGRSTYWVGLILMVPVIGSLAYLLIEVAPEYQNSVGGQRATRKIQDAVNPNRDINTARQNLE